MRSKQVMNKLKVVTLAGIMVMLSGGYAHGQGQADLMPKLEKKSQKGIRYHLNRWLKRGDSKVQDRNEIAGKIREVVKKKIDKEFPMQRYNTTRDTSYKARPEDAFLYKIPAWPFSSTFYAENDLVRTDLSHSWATQSWSSSGRCQDVSDLVFSQEPIRVKDVVLFSRLLSEEKINATNVGSRPKDTQFVDISANHYLALLADHKIIFDASTEEQHLDINYARHYREGELSFGFTIPVVRKRNRIRLNCKSDLTPEEIALLKKEDPLGLFQPGDTQVSDFFASYENFEGFLEDLLAKKGIVFNRKDHEIGIGDISAFMNFEVVTRHAQRCVVGGKIVFPSSRLRDTHKLWDAELGMQGFTKFTMFASALFEKSRYFNPHVYIEGSASPSTHVDRRVPLKKSYDGITPIPGTKPFDGFDIFTDEVTLFNDAAGIGTFTDERDSSVRNFATNTMRLKIRRGPEIRVRLGNIMERFLFRKGFMDVFYDFRAKGKDYLGCRKPVDDFDGSVCTDNSYQVAHRLGARYSYQLDRNWRIHADFHYTFAGRNVLRDYFIGGALSADF